MSEILFNKGNIKLLASLIFTAIVCGGCSVKQAALPIDAPLIGNPTLSSRENKANYMIGLAICNRKKDKFEAQIQIKGEPGEVLDPISGMTVGGESTVFIGIGNTKVKRTKPIHIEIKWRRGNEQGVKNFVVPTEQDNTVQNSS